MRDKIIKILKSKIRTAQIADDIEPHVINAEAVADEICALSPPCAGAAVPVAINEIHSSGSGVESKTRKELSADPQSLKTAGNVDSLGVAPGLSDFNSAAPPVRGDREVALEHRVIPGREDWFLLAHELSEARDAYLNGMGQQGSAARRMQLEEILWNDKGTFIQALQAMSLSLPAQPDREAITRLIYEADSPSDPKDAWKEAQRITDVILSTLIQHGTSND